MVLCGIAENRVRNVCADCGMKGINVSEVVEIFCRSYAMPVLPNINLRQAISYQPRYLTTPNFFYNLFFLFCCLFRSYRWAGMHDIRHDSHEYVFLCRVYDVFGGGLFNWTITYKIYRVVLSEIKTPRRPVKI